MPASIHRRRFACQPQSQRRLHAALPAVLVEPLETRRLLSAAVNTPTAPADLPLAAQQSISAAIGQDQAAYHAATGAAGVTLANPANSFTAQMQSGTLLLSAGPDSWDMSLVGVEYGGVVQPLGAVQTSLNDNRVDSNYGTVDAWYVNGPGGLEQGFTVTPQANADTALTVKLSLGGDLTGTVNAAGNAVTLTAPDGAIVLDYTGLAAYDAAGKALPATLQLQADGSHQDLLIHVNTAGSQGQITIDPLVQRAKISASDGAAGDNFGGAVAVSGNTIVIGAAGATVGGDPGQGAAYVFTATGAGLATVTQVAKLTAADGQDDDHFGCAVGISGNTVVVGAYNATINGNSQVGAVYVFTEPAAGWGNMTQIAKLTSSDGQEGDLFGFSVAISGNTIVAGALDGMVNGNPDRGAAYVFTEPARGWSSMTQTAKLIASDGQESDWFGFSVAISGNTIVAGAVHATYTGNAGAGAAYVFTAPATGWGNMTETGKLTAADGVAGDCFGGAVAVSGNTVVVGALAATVGNNSQQGAAYVYTEPATGWGNMTQTGKFIAPNGTAGDWFGYSVAVSGNIALVGAPNAVNDAGSTYEYIEPAAGWASLSQVTQLYVQVGAPNEEFGCAVAIDGNLSVVGAFTAAINGNGNQGLAFAFVNATITVTPPENQTVTVNQNQSFALGSFIQTDSIGNYSVDVNWGDGSNDSQFSMSGPGTIPAASHTFTARGNDTVTVTVSDSQGVPSNPATFTVDVTPYYPVFGNLTAAATIPAGQASVTFSGTMTAGVFIPPSTENVAITLNGVTQNAAIGTQGNFATTFNTSALRGSSTPYQITYAYAGDAAFASITDNTTTQLTVTPGTASIGGTIYADTNHTGTWNPADPEINDVMVYLDSNNNGKLDAGEISVNTDTNGNYLFSNLPEGNYTVREVAPGGDLQTYPAAGAITITLTAGQTVAGQTFLDAPTGTATAQAVYRLYSPVTLEHLYTSDPNEYNTLQGYVGTWNGEGEVFSEYSGPATDAGVTDEPLYRLYDSVDKQHFWTDSYNEYNTLRQAPWNWNDEGIAGYVFPGAVAGIAATPLYRLMAPQVHLWTTDVNEYDVLASEGWTQEGIIGYVL